MGEIFLKAFEALWQVLVAGIILGAGLPAVFALGIKALGTGRTLAADGATYTSRADRSGTRGLDRALRGLRRSRPLRDLPRRGLRLRHQDLRELRADVTSAPRAPRAPPSRTSPCAS